MRGLNPGLNPRSWPPYTLSSPLIRGSMPLVGTTTYGPGLLNSESQRPGGNKQSQALKDSGVTCPGPRSLTPQRLMPVS